MKYSENYLKAFNRFKPEITLEKFESDFFAVIENFFDKTSLPKIKEKLEILNIEIKENGSSTFDYFTNTIYITRQRLKDLENFTHEAFHFISTESSENGVKIGLNNIIHTDKNDYRTEFNAGSSLNEGANTYFTKKAMEKAGFSCPKDNVAVSYRFAENIFACLCKLVGEDECKKAHFEKGLNYFLKKISDICSQCGSKSKIIKLISSLDSYFRTERVCGFIGKQYSVDSRSLIIDAYKSLVDLFIFNKERNGNLKSLKFSNIFDNFGLTDEDKAYFITHIRPVVFNHYKKRVAVSYKDIVKGNVHLNFDDIENYIQVFFNKCIYSNISDENQINIDNINGDWLPEKYKCGEFYNYILTGCYLIDENNEMEVLKTSNIQQVITTALFDKSKNFMPKDQTKQIKTLMQIISTRLAVRAGCEVSDELVIDSLSKDVDFNLFIMELDSDYYLGLYDKIAGNVKYDKRIVKTMIENVFQTKVQKYKFQKSIPTNLKNYRDLMKLFESENEHTL